MVTPPPSPRDDDTKVVVDLGDLGKLVFPVDAADAAMQFRELLDRTRKQEPDRARSDIDCIRVIIRWAQLGGAKLSR